MVGGDLEELGRIIQPVYLVEDEASSVHVVEKPLGILEALADPGKLAIEELDVRETPCEEGLADSAYAREPQDATSLPGTRDPLLPVAAFYHTAAV